MRVLKVEEDGETGIQEEEALRERFLNLEGRAKQLIAVAAISEWGILEKKSSRGGRRRMGAEEKRRS